MSDLPERILQTTLDDGRVINRSDVIRIRGRKFYWRFLYERENGDLTLWGPVTKQGQTKDRGSFVSIRKDEVL